MYIIIVVSISEAKHDAGLMRLTTYETKEVWTLMEWTELPFSASKATQPWKMQRFENAKI